MSWGTGAKNLDGDLIKVTRGSLGSETLGKGDCVNTDMLVIVTEQGHQYKTSIADSHIFACLVGQVRDDVAVELKVGSPFMAWQLMKSDKIGAGLKSRVANLFSL